MRIFFLAIIICFLGSVGYAAEFSYPPDRKALEALKEFKSGYHPHENGEMYFRTPTSLADEYKVEGVDLQTFEILANEDYAKDKNNVYFYGRKLEGADSESFTIINFKLYFVDLKAYVEAMDSPYSKDKNNVYYKGNNVKEADTKSFTVIDFNFSKDKNNIYSYDKKILEIKPEMLKNDGRIKFTYDGQNYDLKYNNK